MSKKRQLKKETMAKPPAKVTSAEAAAARLGVPVQAVERARRAGCDAFEASGRITLARLAEWLKANPEQLAEATGKAAAEERIARARAERLEFENEVRKGRYILRADADAVAVAYVTGAKAKLLESAASLAPRLAMESDPQEVERELRQLVVDYLGWMAAGNWYRDGGA
jgi:hypothetical protein